MGARRSWVKRTGFEIPVNDICGRRLRGFEPGNSCPSVIPYVWRRTEVWSRPGLGVPSSLEPVAEKVNSFTRLGVMTRVQPTNASSWVKS